MKCQKNKFSLKEDIHYLNCAYKGPMLKASEEACRDALIRERNPVDIEIKYFFEDAQKVREYFALMINALPDQIAIMPSSSYGFSSVLNNILPKPSGNAITIENEFPSGYFALEKWCNQNANQLKIVAADQHQKNIGESWNNNILNSIDEKTSIVLMSSIHWMNGLKFDLEAIGTKCQEVGAKFILDGTQSVGALPIDIKKFKIDALICPTYKWLLGPYSVTLAYISEGFSDGIPLEEAWLNRVNSEKFSQLTNYDSEYRPVSNKYNVGQYSNFILMPMLRESLKQLLEWDPKNIQAYCKDLIQPLKIFLTELGVRLEDERYFANHLFALQLPSNVNQDHLKETLLENKIYVSVRGEFLRLSVNVFNDQKDIQKLIDTIQGVIKK